LEDQNKEKERKPQAFFLALRLSASSGSKKEPQNLIQKKEKPFKANPWDQVSQINQQIRSES